MICLTCTFSEIIRGGGGGCGGDARVLTGPFVHCSEFGHFETSFTC